MRILFDQGTPYPLQLHLSDHEVETCDDRGWSRLQNGELLRTAEQAGFNVLMTTDQNLKYQQNLAGRLLAIIVLRSTSWPKIQTRLEEIKQAVNRIGPGDYIEIPI